MIQQPVQFCLHVFGFQTFLRLVWRSACASQRTIPLSKPVIPLKHVSPRNMFGRTFCIAKCFSPITYFPKRSGEPASIARLGFSPITYFLKRFSSLDIFREFSFFHEHSINFLKSVRVEKPLPCYHIVQNVLRQAVFYFLLLVRIHLNAF